MDTVNVQKRHKEQGAIIFFEHLLKFLRVRV